MLKMKLWLLATCVWLLGCGGCGKEKIYVSKEMRKYEIVSINPPKHFSVDLLDVETHRLFKGESWSKHCSNWRQIRLNTVVTVETYTFKYKGEDIEQLELADINNYFCG